MNQQLLTMINANYSQVLKYIRQQLDSRLKRRVSESDIFQETCLMANRSPKRNMSFEFFLKIIRNVTRKRNLKHLEADDGSLRHEANTSHVDMAMEDSRPTRFEDFDTSNQIAKLIQGMSERHREILTLVHLRGMSVIQAASYIGISEEASKKRYQRAIARMREMTVHLRA